MSHAGVWTQYRLPLVDFKSSASALLEFVRDIGH